MSLPKYFQGISDKALLDSLQHKLDEVEKRIQTATRHTEEVVDVMSSHLAKAGGKLVVCEFSKVKGLLGFVYKTYLRFGLPIVARLISSNPEAYTYLSQSIEAWPDQKQLEQNISSAGFKSVSYKNLSYGVVALHTGER